ncbi:TIR domain-containing protein [Leptospira meyeri]|uniref:TIR domain-containing protein n=1 Tax=Leptospira meyeri TaxID=29508 RepID=UPI001083CC84|nr:TIR domain-containing protein [Leptospira meyeri]TGM68659.1 TIR domain-containing protein [Leptospira meyeri]TGM70598.1 TIR domain-containing protein [Leptospira meyeri]
MKKILLFTDNTDKRSLTNISEKLQSLGYETIENIYKDINSGENWSEWLYTNLIEADVYVCFLNESSFESKGFIQLLNSLINVSKSNQKLFIPITLSEIDLPSYLSNFTIIHAGSISSEQTAIEIQRIISAFSIQKELQNAEQRIISNNIKESSTDYIEKTMDELKKAEKDQSIISIFWFFSSFITLFIGCIFSYTIANKYLNLDDLLKLSNSALIYLSGKSLFILSIFAAVSKLCFSIAKEYRRTSIKNSDRLHAIRFGKFYLDAFKEKIEWKEVKEVFQHWNIDNELLTRINNKSTGEDIKISLIEELKNILEKIIHK